MDPLRLLSRSTRASRSHNRKIAESLPSIGLPTLPQPDHHIPSPKRRRIDDGRKRTETSPRNLDFFSDTKQQGVEPGGKESGSSVRKTERSQINFDEERVAHEWRPPPLDERKRMLKEHKLRVTWLHPPPSPRAKARRKSKAGDKLESGRTSCFPAPLLSFKHLVPRLSVSRSLASNILEQGFSTPTEVQLGALPLLLDNPTTYLAEATDDPDPRSHQVNYGADLLTVAPTGSGKTLAFLIPLFHHLQSDKRSDVNAERHPSALILAPTRELASQIANEGRKLIRGTGIRVTQMRKGMRLGSTVSGADGKDTGQGTIVKADVIVSTPGALQSALNEESSTEVKPSIQWLVLDEADVLLDPLFREQTLDIWNKLSNPNLRVSMWSATMGSNVEELAVSTIRNRRLRLSGEENAKFPEAPLIRLVVGLKDSAVPNVQHKLTYAASEQGKLMGLRQLLHPTTSSVESGPPLRPPFLVFTQTIERAIALHGELLYDIPPEAGGIDRIAVLHSDLSDTARDNVMARFRKGEIWVLITTDLLSRGVDFLGINGVVNYDIPTSSAAYVHRIGRTGRAGRTGGVAVTLYSKEDIPYLKHVANIVALAHKQDGNSKGMDRWLLDALPKLSKNEKQSLRKRGIESRTTRGKQNDPKAARKAKISSKSGYDRRMENKRPGRRAFVEENNPSDERDQSDFSGFD